MSAEITEIKLKLDEKEVILTLEQAKKLKACLEELFRVQVIHDHYPLWYWTYPTTTWTPNWTTIGTTAYLTGSTLELNVA